MVVRSLALPRAENTAVTVISLPRHWRVKVGGAVEAEPIVLSGVLPDKRLSHRLLNLYA
jgi:hypothetical protein